MNAADAPGMEYVSERFEAIGVINQVTVTHARALQPAVSIARRQLRELDLACSRFRADSELAQLNRRGRAIVSPLLLEALEAGLEAAARTDGLVDPTVGAAMSAIGYDRDFDLIARRGGPQRFELRPAAGWESVRVDPDTAGVELPRGCELDLGATAKSFAADRIADEIAGATGSPVLVSLGGDIAVRGAAPQEGWPILVTEDSRATAPRGQVVTVAGGGLATSSTTVRRWRAGRTEMHHIVDPRSGAPAGTCWRTVSVAAESCLSANVAATAAVVLGSEAPAWLTDRGFSARLVDRDGVIDRTGGWPADPSLPQPALAQPPLPQPPPRPPADRRRSTMEVSTS